MLSYDKKKITKKAALMLGRYFYVEDGWGVKSLNQLSGNHIVDLMSGKQSAFLCMELPNIEDIDFNFVGQYINKDNSVFLAYGIQSALEVNKRLFEGIDKIEVLNHLYLKDFEDVNDGEKKRKKCCTGKPL